VNDDGPVTVACAGTTVHHHRLREADGFAGRTLVAACYLISLCLCAPASAADPPLGERVYQTNCAVCHKAGLDRAPNRETLALFGADQILAALERGSMVSMAVTLSSEQRRAVSEYLAGRPLGALPRTPPVSAMCKGPSAFTRSEPTWQGWGGVGLSNTRFQTSEAAGLSAAEVPRLRVKWAFGFPGDIRAYSPPTIVGGRLFLGSQGGMVYSLDAASGCVHWYFDAGAWVRSAATVAEIEHRGRRRDAVFFGDGRGYVHALDAASGEELWRTRADAYAVAHLTGSPAYYEGRLYVPVASNEEAAAASPGYECCRFRGSLVALDAGSGAVLWKTWLVGEPQRTSRNASGAQLWGPSGVPVWSSPAIDPERNAVYVTTGNNYSLPASELSNAFVAMDLDTGEIRWARQITAGDAWNTACRLEDKTNCPDVESPDFDFGASPILVSQADGRRLLVAGQKSGVVYALDPDRDGTLVWQARVGRGGTMGGVQWGSAADAENVYVAVSDIRRIPVKHAWATEADREVGGGMYALRLADGERVWYAPPAPCGERPRCAPAQPGAVTAIPGVAFAGSMDGFLRAYSTADGSILFELDTIRAFDTVNGVPAQGGALDGGGPTIAGGMLFVNSGNPNGGGMPGNVLIALSVDGR
jgi:polyvinyl alcohol dehydrogenase (cytochrome)